MNDSSFEVFTEDESAIRPFFSIGVMTYDRREMLKNCVRSVLSQTFSDFEIIIGNDYPQETLSADALGIHDSRIRFVNYSQNIGELSNMNSLLDMSHGRYFTWLADDDLYASTFLESVYKSLERFKYPLTAFTSYMPGSTVPENFDPPVCVGNQMSGRQFINQYLGRSLKAIGSCGVFDINYIRNLGGIQRLGTGFGPYSDNILVIKSGKLDRVVYINAPLVFFRQHDQSISYTSTNIDAYISAQIELCRRCVDIFHEDHLAIDFYENLFHLLKWCINDFDTVVRRAGKIAWKQISNYLRFLFKYIGYLNGSKNFIPAIGYALYTPFRKIVRKWKRTFRRFFLFRVINRAIRIIAG